MSSRVFPRDGAPEPRDRTAALRAARVIGVSCLLALGCNAERGRAEPGPETRRRASPPAASGSSPEHSPEPLALRGRGAAPPTRPRSAGKGATSNVARPSDITDERVSRARPARLTQRRTVRPEPPQTELAPGANDEFDPGALADVEYALVADNENAFATLVHEKKRVLPRNCRDWKTFRKRGYAPKSALGEHLDGGALVRCGSLEFFARAAPSRISHVRDALLGAGPNTLPAIVASATSRPALQARTAAAARGLTLAELLPSAYTGSSELLGRVAIIEPSSETSVLLNAEVWGDINRDGIEDLVISVLNSSDDGTYLDVRLIEVTRLSAEAPLTVLAVLQ
jgi:hypothetical protein